MALRKITDNDLLGKGVVGMADVPELTALEMQKKVEEVVRDVVIPVLNENADDTVTKDELAQAMFNAGAGDMVTYTYDKNFDGRVDEAENGFSLYIHSMTGRGHLLSGVGENIKFVAVRDWSVKPYLEINGAEAVPVNANNEDISDEDIFSAGALVTCFVHTDEDGVLKCFFKQGDAGVNFKIVTGTEVPASPKENTLWVNTDTAMGIYMFSAVQPRARADESELQEGDIWIVTGTESNISLNLMKKNSIVVCVTGAYQYNGTDWEEKEIQGYTGGQWQEC